ncbi:hypothetical protein [Hymenobacter sp. 102]|uniref:hypothetical protein n=1 Tax=Hymenobacter sp. 102 TaxID=3403152 RepID=UPI003CF5CB01
MKWLPATAASLISGVNLVLGADALLHHRGSVTAVYLLAALLIGLIGFGDCVTHCRLHPQ